MPPQARASRGKSASARSPSPKGRKSARKAAARPAVVSPPTPPVSGSADKGDKRGAGRDSPSTTAASAPVSSGWHATVGAAPVARGRTALARFLAQLFQLAIIAITPPTAQLMCAPLRARAAGRARRPRRAVQGRD